MIDNWSGVEDYPIQVDMNSMKNNILGATYDIDYTIYAECTTNNAILTLSKNSGTIEEDTNTDFFRIVVTPNAGLDTGDEVHIYIKASTTSPYIKEIDGEFILRVGKENITYVIEDAVNSPYCELKVTNTQSYYIVDTPFGNYTQNSKITIDKYMALSDTDKAKCHSALITLSFSPSVLTLDMTNSNYLNASNISDITYNSYNYINGIVYKVDAISSSTIRFYKNDITQNYSYPNANNSSIITFTAQ